MKIYLFLAFIASGTFFFSCENDDKLTHSENKSNSEKNFFFYDSILVKNNVQLGGLFERASGSIKPDFKTYSSLDSNWQFAFGIPENGLKVLFSQKPKTDTIVHLPNRINFPNYPFWYEKNIRVKKESVLYVNADDGAQCFFDVDLQEPVFGEFYFIPTESDSLTLSIRVLNNALKGGLRKVELIEKEEFERYMKKRKLARLNQHLIFLAQKNALKIEGDKWEKMAAELNSENTVSLQSLIEEYEPLRWPEIKNIENKSGNKFSFTAWGDSQGGWRTFSQLIKYMAEKEDDFSIGLGDLVSNGADENQWYSFMQCMQPLLEKQLVFPIVGNHDYDGYYNDLNPILYKKHILDDVNSPAYLSWTYKGAYFLALDPNETFPLGLKGKQREWIYEEMNSPEWGNANWRFVLIHQPPYSQGWPEFHGDDFIRELVDSLAESKKIDFVLSGHSHDYERLTKIYGNQKTHFFILGGAGGGLEPPESSEYPVMDTVIKEHHYAHFEIEIEKVSVKIFGKENQLLDEWSTGKEH